MQTKSATETAEILSKLSVSVPSSEEPKNKTPPKSAKRGRPNKFITLETGEIVRQPTKPQPVKNTPKAQGKPRGRPRKETPTLEAKNDDVNDETPDENINNNIKAQGRRTKRLRISDSESDNVDEMNDSDHEDRSTKSPNVAQSTSNNQRSQRLRRSVVRNIKYADYEVEDVPQRPENVWITEKSVGKNILTACLYFTKS